jgi:tetratricopeptide (TPR) repeat protein
MFYAESWALTHYLMLGDNGSHKPLLLAYLQGLQQDGSQNEAAIKAFGDLNKLQQDLQRYINGSSYFQVHGPAPPPIPDADLRTREISDAEADAYLGGFAALRGRPQEAKPLLEQALQLDPKLPLAYQNLGLMQLSSGQREEALASFSRAVELDPKNALTHYLRAYLSFGQRNVAAGDAQIEDDLRQAIALDPDFAPSYGLLAVYLAASNENLTDALAIARKGVSIEPGNALYALSLAQVLARMGHFEDAETAARASRANATDSSERANADQFLVYLQRARNAVNQDRTYGSESGVSRTPPVRPAASDEENSEPAAPGASTWAEAAGLITQSRCRGISQQIDLQTSTATLHLHGPANGGLKMNLSFDPQPGFNPCTSLKGMRASVLYQPDDADSESGVMTSLRIFGPDGGANSQESSTSETSTTPAKDPGEKAAAAVAITVDGQITEATCSGRDMLVKIVAGARQFILHARDYAHIDYYDDRPGPRTDDFQPCIQLRGHSASVIFSAVEHKGYDGELQSVEIQK